MIVTRAGTCLEGTKVAIQHLLQNLQRLLRSKYQVPTARKVAELYGDLCIYHKGKDKQ